MSYLNIKYKRRFKNLSVSSILIASSLVLSSCSYVYDLFGFNEESSYVTYDSQAVTISPEERSDYDKTIIFYGYRNLSNDKSLDLYNCIDSNIQNKSPFTIKCDGLASDKQISEAIMAYKNDHPEVFWIKDYFEYYNDGSNTFVKISYNMSEEKLAAAKQEFTEKVDEIIASVPTDKNEYEIEKYINNYIIENCVYDVDAVANDNVKGNENDAYGAIVEGSAVCEGYARAFQLLCNSVGIECVNIVGNAGEPHQWNCVKIDNEWYQIDVTWNDADEQGEISYNRYFNLTDKKISKTHKVAKIFKETTDEEYIDPEINCNVFVPECTATKYSYVNQEYVTLHDIDDAENLIQQLADKAKKKADYLNVIFDDELDFDDVTDAILHEGYLYDWFDRANNINNNSPQINCKKGIYIWETLEYITIIIDYN